MTIVLNPNPDVQETSKFYADAETLKEDSGYYTFMNSLPVNPDLWIENCEVCHIAMTRMMIAEGTKTVTNRGQAINPHSEFWFCKSCCYLWTAALGYWSRVIVDGQAKLDCEKIKTTEIKLREEQAMEVEIDPGEKPSPDSTKCSNCKVWRKVVPYKSDESDMLNRTHHICTKCGTGEIVDSKQEAV